MKENGIMSKSGLLAPSKGSLWVRKSLRTEVVEFGDIMSLTDEDETPIAFARRVDGNREQVRLPLAEFYKRFEPRCAEHVYGVALEIHEAKLLRDQVERQKAHILNIEGALTRRNEQIRNLEREIKIAGLGERFEKRAEPSSPCPLSAGAAMADACDRLLDGSKKEESEPIFVGVISDVTWRRLGERGENPERIYATLEASKKDVPVGDHYKLYLGPCVPQCKLEATECESKVFEAERAVAQMKAEIENGSFTKAAANAVNMLADAQAEAYNAQTRIQQLEAEKEDAWAAAWDESKVAEDLEKETAKREETESQLKHAQEIIQSLSKRIRDFVSAWKPVGVAVGGLLCDPDLTPVVEGVRKAWFDIPANCTLDAFADDCGCILNSPTKTTNGAASEPKIVEHIDEGRIIERALSALCNCNAKPGEIHASMCYRRSGLIDGIEGLQKLLDIANESTGKAEKERDYARSLFHEAHNAVSGNHEHASPGMVLKCLRNKYETLCLECERHKQARKDLAEDLVALADGKPCKLALGTAVETKFRLLTESMSQIGSALYEYKKSGSGLAPILKASNGEICGICGGDVSKGAHTWKQCSTALEEESLKDVVRFTEVEAQRDAAVAKLKAGEDFLQTVLQERDHAQQVEVPDALQRAQAAEHERDEEKGRYILDMNAVRLALEKSGVLIEWDIADQKIFPSGKVIKRVNELVDSVNSSKEK